MNSYLQFANYYDKLVLDVDYDKIVNYIIKIFEKYNANPRLILDLACGTGNVTIPLSKMGYEMIGIDLSETMLSVAQDKAISQNQNILFLNQDIQSFELYGTVDAAICILDSVNHILNKKGLIKFFSLVKNYLNYGGIFIFDINSKYKLEKIIGNNIFIKNENDIFNIWENNYIKNKNICEFFLTFFVKTQNNYIKFEEAYKEKAYEIFEIESILKDVGIEVLGIYENTTFNKPKTNSERIFFVCRRKD